MWRIGRQKRYNSAVYGHINFKPGGNYRRRGRCTQRHTRLSKFPPDIRGRIHSVYVNCDILEHVPVGDTKAPLLRIVNTNVKSIGNVHRVCNPLLYVPLQKKNVQHHWDRHENGLWYDRSLSIGKVVRRVGVSSRHSSVFLHIRWDEWSAFSFVIQTWTRYDTIRYEMLF